MIFSGSAIGASWTKSIPGFRKRTTSLCRGEWPTCRGLQKKFRSPAFVWSKLGNMSSFDSVWLETKTKPPGKNGLLKTRDDLVPQLTTMPKAETFAAKPLRNYPPEFNASSLFPVECLRPKHQAPNPKLQGNSKFQAPTWR